MFQILLLIVIFQVLFFSVLIITKKNKTLQDKILFAWLLLLSIHILLVYLSIVYPNIVQFRYLGFCFSILHGVFIYFYTKSLSKQILKFHSSQLCHFIPFTFSLLLGLCTYNTDKSIIAIRAISFLSTFTYIFLSLKSIKQYQSMIEEQYSNVDKINLDWMKHLIYGLLIFCICGLIFGLIPSLNDITLPFNGVFSILILVFICILGFKGIRQNNILGGIQYGNDFPSTSEQVKQSEKKNAQSLLIIIF